MPASSIKRPREKPEPGRKLLVIPFIYYMVSRAPIQPKQTIHKRKREEISYIK